MVPKNIHLYSLSGVGTEAGVYAFSQSESAFLPKGENDWIPLNNPNNTRFYSNCAVQISHSELFVMGGSFDGNKGNQVWKLDINTHLWTRINDMKRPRMSFGCSVFKKNGKSQYVLLSGLVSL